MYYTVYKITNLINNKIYIGVHKTKDLDDGYMGSGVAINRATTKYGLENFKKEYLAIFDNVDDMYNMETQLVNEDFVNDSNTYNMKLGGTGSWDFVNNNEELRKKKNKKARENANKTMLKKYGESYQEYLTKCVKESHKHRTPESYKEAAIKAAQTMLERYGTLGTFDGRSHSEETKRKMSRAKKGKGLGTKNSQHGTCWIFSEKHKQSKKIKIEELDSYTNDGWVRGRKLKF